MLDRVRIRIGAWHTRIARRRPFWTGLRSVGNTPAAQAVILIPLLGYWIIFNAQIADYYANLTGEVMPRAQSGPPWRLFATYFGLCFVAVASALYQWRCPSEIKLYPSASEYVGRISPEMSEIELARVRKILQEADIATQLTAENRDRAFGDPPLPLESPGRVKRDLLQLHFDLCNRSSPIARMIVAGCYGFGFLILVGLSLEVFWRVTRAMFRTMLAG
jgi:hypothetical protein